MASDDTHVLTARLDLAIPTPDDTAALYAITSDAAVWRHYPQLRHTTIEQARHLVDRLLAGWDTNGLGMWTVRRHADIIGYAGVGLVRDDAGNPAYWNLGYRFAAAAHGQGFATEVAREAVTRAGRHSPDLPLVGVVMETNPGSIRVLEKVGMRKLHSGPDAGNPNPGATRLIYADRDLDAATLALTMAH